MEGLDGLSPPAFQNSFRFSIEAADDYVNLFRVVI